MSLKNGKSFRNLVEEVALLQEAGPRSYMDDEKSGANMTDKARMAYHSAKDYAKEHGGKAVSAIKSAGSAAKDAVTSHPYMAAGGAAAAVAAGAGAMWLRHRSKKVGPDRAKKELAMAKKKHASMPKSHKAKMAAKHSGLRSRVKKLREMHEELDMILDELTD